MMRSLFILCLICLQLPMNLKAQRRYDILITECLPDPSPVVGMPESSFIELKNRSHNDYNLHNWKISNGMSSATLKSDYLLKADSFLILCNTASAKSYSSFGRTLGISGFPSLNNEAGDIILSTEEGAVIHAVHYNKSWFGNELKATGGWSLEMIDPSNPCMGRGNWTASVSSLGGTPGKINSVDAINPDDQGPSLMRIITTDSLNLVLIFDEAMDSASVSSLADYTISDGIGSPETALAMPPFFDRVLIHLKNPLSAGKIYTVSVQQLSDCNGNEIGMYNTCKAGLPEKVKSGDIIFNEILFNPPPYGYDYLELYNRSSKIINCSALFLAGREMNGSLKDPVALIKDEIAFFPGEYFLLTENPDWIIHHYTMANAARILSVSALPSMPDDLGKVVLLNASGETLDELDYDHRWHSPLLANESGVALERIRPDIATFLASNWTSAAASAEYGTPGYKNSESAPDSPGADLITIEPKIFSPDMDGYQDYCFINYHLPSAGFMGSISIYDISGRVVRNLVNNMIWSTIGSFRWDGLDDQQNLLSMGHYIIYIELFRPDGIVIRRKLVCTLVRRN